MPLEIFDSITQLSFYLKKKIESDFGSISVKGEVSGVKMHTSGHLYFSLKDNQSVLDGICWKSAVGHLSVMPEDGMEVRCFGRLTTYPGRSKYQIIAQNIVPEGQGALLKLLEAKKAQLREEGLFDVAHKKPLPAFPRVIGVITSATGAVIQDILHRIAARFPCHVIVWPVKVQGTGACNEIVRALQGFNAIKNCEHVPDLIIVARGGGSIEDLWTFNEEAVARAVFASHIPVISAVGHETDTTLIDYVADQRAPTPSAAAEMAVPVQQEWQKKLQQVHSRFLMQGERIIERFFLRFSWLMEKMPGAIAFFETHAQRLDEALEALCGVQKKCFEGWKVKISLLQQRLPDVKHVLEMHLVALNSKGQTLEIALERYIHNVRHALQMQEERLEGFSYKRALKRGFCLAFQGKTLVRSVEDIASNASVNIRVCDGLIDASVVSTKKTPPLF